MSLLPSNANNTEAPQPGILAKPVWLSYAALLAVYLAWGTTFAAIRVGLNTVPPEVLVCQRFVVSGVLLVLVGWALAPNRFRPVVLWCILYPNTRTFVTNLAIGVLLYGIGNGLTPWPLLHLPIGLAAALIALNPFLLIGLSTIIPPKEPLPKAVLGALGVGTLGLVILMWPHIAPLVMHPNPAASPVVWALLLFIVIELGWSSGSLVARRQTRDNIALPHYLILVGHQNLLVAIIYGVVAAFTHQQAVLWPAATPVSGLLAAVYLGVIGTCVGMLCYMYTLKTLPLPLASTFNYVTPVITALIGVWWLHEASSWHLWVGLGVILSSVCLVQYATQGLSRPRWPIPPRPIPHPKFWFKRP